MLLKRLKICARHLEIDWSHRVANDEVSTVFESRINGVYASFGEVVTRTP